MAGGERLTIHMSGGGPWGFRLYGGENDPLVIAKLRKRSKAAEAGIIEGDVLLSINGYSCKGLNHPTAMAMVEQAGHNLTFELLRGSSDKYAVDAAFQDLGQSIHPLPASQIPSQQKAPSPFETRHQRSQFGGASYQYEAPEDQNENVMNGYTDYEAPGVNNLRQVFQQGNTTKEITTETSKQQIGGTTITKIRREEVTHSGKGPGLSPYPVHEQRGTSPNRAPMFQVSNNINSGTRKPGVWAPSGQSQNQMNVPLKVSAPSGVNVAQNPDQSITMTFDNRSVDSKENIAPSHAPQIQKSVPGFNVKKVSGAVPNAWNPTAVQMKPQPPPAQQQPKQEDFTHFPFEAPTWRGMDQTDTAMDTSEPFVDDDVMNIHLSKILHEGLGSDYDSGNESPGTFWRRKKKIFADSSFYDDPEHKYPTIEEQIKMARKVALSLIAPANRNARGHKMFLKRKQKAVKWTTGLGPIDIEISEDEDEKYFNPDPWNKPHTWQPPSHQPLSQQHYNQPAPPVFNQQPPAASPAAKVPVFVPPPPPPPPPSMEHMWKPKVIPTFDNIDNDRSKSMSANEIEAVRLHGQKTKHTSVAPQLAFSLADDLRQMKGKGGRLFAKRKEKSEKWVVGETWGQGDANPAIMEKILLQHDLESGTLMSKPEQHHGTPNTFKGGMPVNRLKELVDPPKAKMTPWDAAADYGNIDQAFDHLDGYLSGKQGIYKNAVASNLEKAAQRSYMTPFRPEAHGVPVNVSAAPSKMPDYSSKIKPWQSSESLSTYSFFSETTSTTSSVEPCISLNSPRNTPTDLQSILSASTPNVYNTTPAVSQPMMNSSASEMPPRMNITANGTKNDILAPQPPRGWNKSAGEGPDMGLYFPKPGERERYRPAPEPQKPVGGFTPKSSISSGTGSGASFRPVKFNAPSSNLEKAGMFDAGPALWNKGPQYQNTQGPPSFMSGGPASSFGSQRDVNEEMGYCDL